MKKKLLNVFLISLIIISFIYESKCEIVFVFEHFRHGARSSVYIDKHNIDIYDIKWIGDGELTPVGMRMLYLIGVHIRNKYSNIINNLTSSNDLLVYSTDLNRTIVSAEAQLLGMFPPKKGDIILDEHIKYSYPPNNIPIEVQEEINKLDKVSIPSKIRAIPINFFHKEKKPYLLTEEDECPRTKLIKQQNYKKKMFKILSKISEKNTLINGWNTFILKIKVFSKIIIFYSKSLIISYLRTYIREKI